MAEGPLSCRRRSQQQQQQQRVFLLSNQVSPPHSPCSGSKSPTGSSSCRARPSSSSTRTSPNHRLRAVVRRLAIATYNFLLYERMTSSFSTRQQLESISRLCAIYSFTGILFTAFVGTMIKNQPIYIRGISSTNQEITKQSAFGAMGMFLFLFTTSIFYLGYVKYRRWNHDEEDEFAIRARGYMRPLNLQSRGRNGSGYDDDDDDGGGGGGGGGRNSQDGMELSSAVHSDSDDEEGERNDDDDDDDDRNEFQTVIH